MLLKIMQLVRVRSGTGTGLSRSGIYASQHAASLLHHGRGQNLCRQNQALPPPRSGKEIQRPWLLFSLSSVFLLLQGYAEILSKTVSTDTLNNPHTFSSDQNNDL